MGYNVFIGARKESFIILISIILVYIHSNYHQSIKLELETDCLSLERGWRSAQGI